MKILRNSILCLGLFCFSNISAEQVSKEREKIYIQPDQIRIEQQGMFIDFLNQSVEVSAIHRDGVGTYVFSSEYKLSRCPRGHYSPDGDGLCDEPGCPYNR